MNNEIDNMIFDAKEEIMDSEREFYSRSESDEDDFPYNPVHMFLGSDINRVDSPHITHW